MKIVKYVLAIAVLFGICYVHSSETVPVSETDGGVVTQTVVVPTQLPPQEVPLIQNVLKKDEGIGDDPYYGMHISAEEEYWTLMFTRF